MTDTPNPSRRTFLATSCATAVGCALAAEGCGPVESNVAVATGFSVSDVAEGMSIKTRDSSLKLIVGRDAGGFFAMSSTCTHEGFTIVAMPLGVVAFECPNHMSRFSATGAVLSTPATRDLPHYEVSFSGTGTAATILVNKGTVVPIGTRYTAPA